MKKTMQEWWNEVKSDPKTYKRPPFPKTGEVDITACGCSTPIRLEWNCESDVIIIDGKAVKVLYLGGWSFKVCRAGIYTDEHTAGLVYSILDECATHGPLDTMYYRMLTRAKQTCQRVA